MPTAQSCVMMERTEFIYTVVMRARFKQRCVPDVSELFPIIPVPRYGNSARAETVMGNDMTVRIDSVFADGNKCHGRGAACVFCFLPTTPK